MSFTELLSNANLWAAVSALAGAVSTIAALLTIWQARLAQKSERDSRRAYIRVVSEDMEFSEDGAVSLPLEVSNIGGHPAIGICAKLLIVDPLVEGSELLNMDVVSANELVQGGTLKCEFKGPIPAKDTPRQLVLFAIGYKDSALNRDFEQFFFFMWRGMVNGQPSPILTHAIMDPRKAKEYLAKYLKDFSSAFNQAIRAA